MHVVSQNPGPDPIGRTVSYSIKNNSLVVAGLIGRRVVLLVLHKCILLYIGPIDRRAVCRSMDG